MATKIRLQRHGRKGYAYYHIVIADERAPRDGRFIARIGSYNPNTNPATVNVDFEAALKWLNCGAQPTDTVRNLLSGEGVMLMKHLQGGVAKGAFSQEEADKKFQAWKDEKAKKQEKAVEKVKAAAVASAKERLEAEKEVNKAKAAAVAKKLADKLAAEEEAAKAAAAEAAAQQEAPAEAAAEAPAEEAAAPEA
ncbi:MAG: 30S ribosomal protein S16 [Paludibacteraceae bacterium]|nr:30S ribosomal protein S16 [Paludibacteraceae bacterium]